MNKNLWDRIEQARGEWNVLEHPFYQRWSAGELTRDELADYSGQYRYATEAIARMSSDIAAAAPSGERAGLEAHAAEEASHQGAAGQYASAMGADPTLAGHDRASGKMPAAAVQRCQP